MIYFSKEIISFTPIISNQLFLWHPPTLSPVKDVLFEIFSECFQPLASCLRLVNHSAISPRAFAILLLEVKNFGCLWF